jgi:hypothetical protein
VIIIALSVSGTIIFFCTNYSLQLKFKYPQVSCETVGKDYNLDFKTKMISDSDSERYTNDAIKEYNNNKMYEDAGKATHYQGTMQCFC